MTREDVAHRIHSITGIAPDALYDAVKDLPSDVWGILAVAIELRDAQAMRKLILELTGMSDEEVAIVHQDLVDEMRLGD
jgi:hypothetical protein